MLSVKPKQKSRLNKTSSSFYGQSQPVNSEMSALKIIYKGKLNKEEIRIIRDEANILEQLEGKQNISTEQCWLTLRTYEFISSFRSYRPSI